MNLPTKLTILRILLIPVFVVLFFVRFPFHCTVATAVFMIASFTDFLDGYLARKNNLVTDLGKFLDPIADKMLVACALFAAVALLYDVQNEVDGALAILGVVCSMIIICRELLVSGFRIVASSKSVVLAADKLGKTKTVLQMFALILLLPVPDFYAYGATSAVLTCGDVFLYAGLGLLTLATVMAIASGANYLVKNKRVLGD